MVRNIPLHSIQRPPKAFSVLASAFPDSPKQVAIKLSEAVQLALQDRQQRIEVRMPSTLCFGLWGKKPGRQILGDPDTEESASVQRQADRDLAYLLVEMFQNYADSCVCVMPDVKAAKAVEREWARAPFRPRILSSVARATKRSGIGFSGPSQSNSPPKVLIVARPQAQSLTELASVSEELGMDAVIIVTNPEEPVVDFTPAFHLEENPHPQWRGGILYHTYGGGWVLGTASNSGEPVDQGRTNTRPSLELIDAAFSKIADDSNWFSKKGAAAALRRREVAAAVAASTAS
eukprot:CAMPEP_0119299666 /NCGR_PEP_ID=MMETSP1333-20130426/1712_1 /TAXON_ID=418940 /ORGANISM="Scyphosphaera apsteinii, Strain RCC1455" /LENGTH=289 /DNA_ID=CAMNT_0007301167 /DNA_START=84 /DNA_END=953 /DNA_ORIENTATION=+